MGAWIETGSSANDADLAFGVAPYMGAWIETLFFNFNYSLSCVAPYMGAWIETNYQQARIAWAQESRPIWVRGLKLARGDLPMNPPSRRALYGCVD